MFKRFFKSKVSVESIALSLGLVSTPSESYLQGKREALMASLFFGVFETLADSKPDNVPNHLYSWERQGAYKSRVKLTAYGAYLHRLDVCSVLLDFHNYSYNKQLATPGLTPQMRQDDKTLISDVVSDVLTKHGYSLLDLIECDLEELSIGDPKKYYAIYAKIFGVLHTYTFNVEDLTYITRNLMIALCDCIALCETVKEKPEVAVLRKYEALADAAIACTFPLSFNSYNELRNGLPKDITSRMHGIKYKTLKLNKGEYVSPLQAYRNRLSKEKLNG